MAAPVFEDVFGLLVSEGDQDRGDDRGYAENNSGLDVCGIQLVNAPKQP